MEIFLRVLLLLLILVLGYFAQSSTVMYAAAALITILLMNIGLERVDMNQTLELIIQLVVIGIVILALAQFLNYATESNLEILGQKFTKGHGFLGYDGDILAFLKKNCVTIGILFLMIFGLVPVAQGELTFVDIGNALLTWRAWVAIATGVLITIMAKNGVPLMTSEPEVLGFLVMGIIIGVIAFDGYPTGPLIGMGIAYYAFLIIETGIKFLGTGTGITFLGK